MLLDYPQPATKPAMSFHGHNEVESSINLRKRGKDGMTPSTNINLFKTDNNLVNKSIVSNASSIIPSSANSFVIIGDEQLSSLVERPSTLPAIIEISEKEASSESSQSSKHNLEALKSSLVQKINESPSQHIDGSVHAKDYYTNSLC